MRRDEIIQDLLPFCDIGADAPTASERDGKLTLKFFREGKQCKLIRDQSNGKILVNFSGGQARSFSSFPQMLSSDSFANLRRWADLQRDYLKAKAVPEKDLIPIQAKDFNGRQIEKIEQIEALLGAPRDSLDSTEIMLLDGPAGIGKTTVIEQIAMKRSENYRSTNKPLVLHVKSRGRVLSNLQDLMAFSLQTLRLSITYDQVPVLVKHGLIVLAIDGFDELGDPNGYELAWSQVNDLITFVRGKGTIILAGRDTFVGRDRLLKDVKSLRSDRDVVNELTLDAPNPIQAKNWLKKLGGWNDSHFEIPAVSVLMEEGSYALRPVFLRLLKEQVKPKDIKTKSENDLTTLLVNHMIDREATKFGDAVEKAMTTQRIKDFLGSLLREIAREMADSQTESIDANTLLWLAEAALGDGWPQEILSLVKNRVGVVAFLAEDERQGHRKFSHLQIMNFFLANETIRSISAADYPKFVRRNVLGREFLSIFSSVITQRSSSGDEEVAKFFENTIRFTKAHTNIDRGLGNSGALLLAALSSWASDDLPVVGGMHIEDALMKGTMPKARIHNIAINQLDVRGCDLGLVDFEDFSVVRLIADEATVFSSKFPNVSEIALNDGRQIVDQDLISSWIDSKGRKSPLLEKTANGLPVKLVNHPVYKLLGRACRLRQYWLRSNGDLHAARILNDEWWPTLSSVLAKHGFLREEVEKPASGKQSTFFHVKKPDTLLSEDLSIDFLKEFYSDLFDAINA